MKIYFAAIESSSEKINYPKLYFEYTQKKKKLNVLMSYYYIKREPEKYFEKYSDFVNDFMLDSGAYTFFDSGKNDEIKQHYNDFKNFIKSHTQLLSSKVSHTFTLDYNPTIYGFDENYKIYLELRELYQNIVPVIHQFSDDSGDDEIDGYSSKNPNIIAIGQILDVKGINKVRGLTINRQKLISTVNKIKNNFKCHLLGITNYNILMDVMNIDTCDSRSWLLNSTTGKIFFNTKDKNGNLKDYTIHFPEYDKSNSSRDTKLINYDLWDKDLDRRDDIEIFHNEMKSIGLDIKDFRGYNHELARTLANFYYYEKMIEYINKEKDKSLEKVSYQKTI